MEAFQETKKQEKLLKVGICAFSYEADTLNWIINLKQMLNVIYQRHMVCGYI